MQKSLLLASAICFAAMNASAFDLNPYVAAKAKYAFARNEVKATGSFNAKRKINDEVFGGSLAIGATHEVMNGDFRFEVEYTKNGNAKDRDERVKTQAVLFNVYYDFNLDTALPIKPYVGAGLGWGRAEFERGAGSIKDDSASAQVGGGVNYKINDHVVADLGYRYISYGDFDEEYRGPGLLYEKYEYEPHAHEFLLGLRYDF